MNADSYYEPPEPSAADVMDEANQDADNLVAEWASEGEYEVWIAVHLNARSLEPLFEVQRVAHDGDVLFQPENHGPGEQFDTVEDMRAYLERTFPLLTA